MAESADVVVVGAGLFGTSIAFQLARRGAGSVVLVERGPVCSGDSGVSFSMIRRHYSNEPVARLAMRGVEIIKHWPEEVGTGDSGYVRTGYLLTATPDRVDALRDNVTRLRSWGLETSVVDLDEITAFEPLLSLEGISAGAWEPDGGFADRYRMTLAWFAAGVQAGVRPALGRTVTRILVDRGRAYGVDTDAGPIHAGTVVLAAGSWGRELAQTASLELPISLRRLEVAFVRQPADRPQVQVTFSDMASNVVMRPDRAGLAWVVAYQPEVRTSAATTALVSSAPSTNRQFAPASAHGCRRMRGGMGRRIRRRLRLHARLESPRRPGSRARRALPGTGLVGAWFQAGSVGRGGRRRRDRRTDAGDRRVPART